MDLIVLKSREASLPRRAVCASLKLGKQKSRVDTRGGAVLNPSRDLQGLIWK